MSCSVLTAQRLDSLLAGSLANPELQLLRAHLSAPCDDCLTRLSDVDGERILWALAGPAAELSEAEQQQLFSKAVASQPSSAPSRKLAVVPHQANRPALKLGGLGSFLRSLLTEPRLRPALALAGLVLVSLPVLLFYATDTTATSEPYQGLKGTQFSGAPQLELWGFVGEATPEGPRVARRAMEGEKLHPGERLLLRYRLEAQAYVYFLAQGPTGPPEILDEPGPTPPGEYEWSKNGQAMAADFPFDGTVKVVGIAAMRPLRVEQLKSLELAALRALCDDCQMASLTVVAQSSR